MKFSKYHFIVISIFQLYHISNAQWSQTNLTPGGTITTLSSNNDIVFAGSEGAGSFVSSNGGKSWIPARDGVPAYISSSLIIGNKIYAGTSYGLFLSENYGQKWTQILESDGYRNINSIAYSENALYVGCGEGNYGHIYYTTNNAVTWNELLINNSYAISEVSSLICKNNKIYVSTMNDGVYVYTIGNSTWKKIFSDYCSTMFLDGSNIYIAGSTSLVEYNIDNNSFNNFSGGIGLSNKYPEKLFLYSNKLFAATRYGLYVSRDEGLNWSYIDATFGSQFIRDITEFNGKLFVGSDKDGIYCSSDGGESWTECNTGITNTIVYNLAKHENTLFCVDSRGLWSSNDLGVTWMKDQLNSGATLLKIFGDTIFVGDFSRKIFKKNVNDSLWIQVPLPTYDKEIIYDFMKVDRNYYLATEAESLFKSTDNGKSWKKINKGLSKSNRTDFQVYSLLYKNKVLYAGTGEGLFRSLDDGENWSFLIGSYNGMGSNVVTISVEGNNICAGAEQLGGLFYSTNNGATWTRDLELIYIYSVIIKDNNILVGTSEGIIFSNDLGKNWYTANDGFYQNPFVKDICILNNYIYASLVTQGIWKVPVSYFNISDVKSVGENITSFNLEQNYPNPFNPSTLINYSLAKEDFISLKVFDILGREVASLVSEVKGPGNYSVRFDGSKLSSGIYIYRLSSAERQISKKLLLLK